MITIEVTKEQLSDVIRGVELLIRESENELSNMSFFGYNENLAKIFMNDIEEVKELKEYLKSKI
jgi:hypothetical protein